MCILDDTELSYVSYLMCLNDSGGYICDVLIESYIDTAHALLSPALSVFHVRPFYD